MRRSPQPRSLVGVIATSIAFAVASASPVVRAQTLEQMQKPSAADLARAEELYDNGRTLFAEGSYAAAATAFEQAHELSGNLDMLFNAALAHDRAGNFETAIELLDRYRALAPASEREQLDERKRSLQLRLEKQREAAANAPAESDPDPEPTTSDTTPLPADTTAPRERRVRPRTWAVLGAGAAVLAIGTGLGAASLVRSRRAKAGCTDATGDLLCEDRVADPARSSRPLAIAADVSFAIGGALAATFIALLVLDLEQSKRDGAAQRRTRALVHATADGLAVSF